MFIIKNTEKKDVLVMYFLERLQQLPSNRFHFFLF